MTLSPIFADLSDLPIESCTFIDNEELVDAKKAKVATNRLGGVIYFVGTHNLSVTGSTFVNNHVGATKGFRGGGGAMFVSGGGAILITNSTFTNNEAGTSVAEGKRNHGGAILLVEFGGTFTLSHCTISGNKASQGSGGGLATSDCPLATINLENPIIFGNKARGGGEVAALASTSAVATPDLNIRGVCIIPDISNGRLDGVVGGLVLKNVIPKLKSLGSYGGRTQTMALEPGSPAIDQAPDPVSGLLADQCGNPRKRGPWCDIGAFEYAPFSLNGLGVMVTTSADESDFDISQGAGISLREAIREAPTGAAIAFDPALGPSPTITLDPARGPLRPRAGVSRTIDGGGFTPTPTNAGVTIDGGTATQLWQMDPSVALTLKRFTLKGGNGRQSNVGNFVGGGAIANGGTLTRVECSLENNGSVPRGGGIENIGTLLAERCTFASNTANTSPPHGIGGGGALVNLGKATVRSCTLAGNTAFYGGAIDQIDIPGAALPALEVIHCTIVQNTAMELDGGGGIFSLYDWDMDQSIVAGNTALALANDVVNSNGFNVQRLGLATTGKSIVPKFFNVNGGKIGGKVQADGLVPTGTNEDLLDSDPKLDGFGFFGGPTSTISLLAGSPAIGAGSALVSSDQRGFAITGGADLGAFEFGAFGTGSFKATLGDTTPQAPGLIALAAAPIVITNGDSELTLDVKPDGSFKGTLVFLGAKYSFSGQFDADRNVSIQVTGKNLPTLTLELTLGGIQDNFLEASVTGAGFSAATAGG